MSWVKLDTLVTMQWKLVNPGLTSMTLDSYTQQIKEIHKSFRQCISISYQLKNGDNSSLQRGFLWLTSEEPLIYWRSRNNHSPSANFQKSTIIADTTLHQIQITAFRPLTLPTCHYLVNRQLVAACALYDLLPPSESPPLASFNDGIHPNQDDGHQQMRRWTLKCPESWIKSVNWLFWKLPTWFRA